MIDARLHGARSRAAARVRPASRVRRGEACRNGLSIGSTIWYANERSGEPGEFAVGRAVGVRVPAPHRQTLSSVFSAPRASHGAGQRDQQPVESILGKQAVPA
jgi:hypothetical protein